MLEREEYVEQAYLFRVIGERLPDNVPLQEILQYVRQELLATTKLPLAVDYLLAELRHTGMMATAMAKLGHYFAPFQTYVIEEAESDRGRFDIRTAVDVLQFEAECRASGKGPQGLFMYQFECLCRNRLRYDPGLGAMAKDPAYSQDWRDWILIVRSQIGLRELADLTYVRSEEFLLRREQAAAASGFEVDESDRKPVLFGQREGRIAFANRQKDPLYLFAALQRHLDYPAVPRLKRIDPTSDLVPQLQRRIESLEMRLKLIEEENRGGIDITQFYGGKLPPDFQGESGV
jgi:hypothetical protein